MQHKRRGITPQTVQPPTYAHTTEGVASRRNVSMFPGSNTNGSEAQIRHTSFLNIPGADPRVRTACHN